MSHSQELPGLHGMNLRDETKAKRVTSNLDGGLTNCGCHVLAAKHGAHPHARSRNAPKPPGNHQIVWH